MRDVLAGRAFPRREDPDGTWLDWINDYPAVRAAHLTCTRIDLSGADFVLDDGSFPLNPKGAINGGFVSLAADQAMGAVAIRSSPTGSLPVTAVLQVHFHRPALAPLRLLARLVPAGRFIKTVEVEIIDRAGRRCSTATGTMSVGSPSRRSTSDRAPDLGAVSPP